jgi:hypothetical protein
LETPNKHHWQEALALALLIDDEKKLGDCQFDLWKQSYVSACAAVFGKLRRSDSRVVLGTTSDDGDVTPSSSSSI